MCKYGLPTGDLYEFSALTVLRYEKKVKAQRKKELEERTKVRNVPARPKVEESPEREESPKKSEAFSTDLISFCV